MITKECKQHFENWLIRNYSRVIEEFPFIMQYGLYEKFFLENGIIINIQPLIDYDETTYTKVLEYNISVIKLNNSFGKTRHLEAVELQSAKLKAIEAANKIYNEWKKESGWVKEVEWREENRYWFQKSQEISLSILSFLRQNEMKKETLELFCKFPIDLTGKHDWKISELRRLEYFTNIKFLK